MAKAREALAQAAHEHLWARRTLAWAGLLAVLGAVLTQVPLFDVLGFESCFALALAGSVAAADLGGAFARRLRGLEGAPLAGAPPLATCFQAAGRAALVAELLLVPPVAILCVNALWVRNCDWSFGFLCALALPGLSVVLATAVGFCAGALVPPGRRILGNALPHLLLAATVLASLWRFYSEPAVFSYNGFAGYFPGNLYDERLALEAPFWWARLFHGMLAAAALAAAALLIELESVQLRVRPLARCLRRRRALAALIAAGACAAAVWSRSGELGFAVDEEDMTEALPRRMETEHFVIHYPPGGAIERDILFIAEDHEFRLAQVVRTLGVAPPDKIQSFYFDSPETKHRLMGARNVYMAKPWREEIYINHAGFPHQVLRHEIAHVIAGRFGDPIFRVSVRRVLGLPLFFNVGLIEGIAVAADWPNHFTHALTPHESVKAMQELGFAPPIERLLSTGFLSFSSARSYTAAGSFVRFLLDRYGVERLQQLYGSGGEFEEVYGRSATALAAEWQTMLDGLELSPGAAEVVRERFRRRSIFDRPCPHAIAGMREEMHRHRREGRIDEAIEIGRDLCRDVPGEPLYLIQLADLLAEAGFGEEADALYSDLAADAEHLSSSLRALALLRSVGLAVRGGNHERAAELLARAAALPLEDDLARTIYVSRQVLALEGPAAAPLRAYLWGDPLGAPPDPARSLARAAEAALLAPELGVAHYLVGRQLRGRGDPAATARALTRALDAGDLGALVEREAARLLAEAAYLAGDHATVERAAAILVRPDQPRVTQLYGHDWRERLHWKRTGQVP